MLSTLSWALSTSQLANMCWFEPEIQQKKPEAERTLKEASNIVNNLIHNEIKRTSQTQKCIDLTSLDINEQLDNINPLLFQFLTAITQLC